MKAKILEILKDHFNEYVSGEEISTKLDISRTAVWKHIKTLKEKGYIIESQPNQGHKLVKVPDTLHPRELAPLIQTRYIGTEITYLEQVGSTNDIAKDLAKASAEGTIVLAEEQLGGKGRLGRNWASPKGGGIWLSVILKPNINPSEAPKLTSVAALAVVKAIREVTGLAVGIKWPNDIVYQGRKIAGILTEMSAEIDKVIYIVLGIGINVNLNKSDFSAEIADKATSIKEELSKDIPRKHLVAAILKELELEYEKFIQGDLENIFSEVKHLSVMLGKSVIVSNFKATWEGTVLDIDTEGALVLRTNEGEVRTIISGEVSLRGATGSYTD